MSAAEVQEHDQNPPAEATAEPVHDHEHVEGEEHDHSHNGTPSLNPECTRSVDIEVEAEEVDREYAAVIKRYRKLARIPGFRAGKVPESLIRSKFSKEIRQDVLESLLPQQFRLAIERQGVQPVSQPQVTNLSLDHGQPLHFTAVFEVLPAIDVTGYHDVKVDKPSVELTEEEFQTELGRIRDSRASFETVDEDRPLVRGDWAQISFTGEQKDVGSGDSPASDIKGDDVTIELGGENTLQSFTDVLTGATAGQELDAEVQYPEDFGERRLAGKIVLYHMHVKGIKRKVTPELNDEFAKELGEYQSFDEFSTKLRESLAHNKQRRVSGEGRERLVEALTARYQFPVPETLVQQQVDTRLERGLRALAQQGMKPDDMRALNFDRLRTAQRDSAVDEVRGALILDRIADDEHVEVPEEELDQQLQWIALESREPVETLRKRLTDDGSIAKIREQLRREKTAAQLYERVA